MGKNTYFKGMTRQIDSAMPILTPPRYLARRMETDQFETFAKTSVLHPTPQLKLQSNAQTASNKTPNVKNTKDFPTGDHLPENTQQLPIADSIPIGKSSEHKPNGMSVQDNFGKHTDTPLASEVISHSDSLNPVPFLSKTKGNLPINELPKDFFPSTSESMIVQTREQAPPSSFLANSLLAEKTETLVKPFADIQQEKELQKLPMDTQNTRTTERIITIEKTMDSSTISPDLNLRSNEVQKIQTNTAINEGVSRANESKTTHQFETPTESKQKSKPDNTDLVHIGVLEITVVSAPEANKQVKTDSTPNKLAWSRGVSRGYGLKQG